MPTFLKSTTGPRGGVAQFSKYKSGQSYGGDITGVRSNFACFNGAGRGYLLPFTNKSASPVSFDRIMWYNSAADSDNLRLGVFADNGATPVGGAALAQGAIAMSGGAADNALTIDITLTPGQLVWIIGMSDASITGDAITPVVGAYYMDWTAILQDAVGAFSGTVAFRVDNSYGAFPDPFSYSGGPYADSLIPNMRLRAT